MKNLTRREVADFFSENDRYLILTHRNPDGDTLGSAAALCRGLRRMGKTAFILENPEITQKYQFLMPGLCKHAPEDGDTLISVDIASPEMLPAGHKHLTEQVKLRIDHHGTAIPFTSLSLVEPEAAACGEIIYGILNLLGIEMDKEIADAIYVAVSTDTGRFCFANTTAQSLRIAADCKDAGCDMFRLNYEMFETHSLAKLRLQGHMAEHAIFLKDGEMAICTISRKLCQELGLTEDDMDAISGFPRTIAGVKLAATLRENGDTSIKVSVRAVPGYDAGALCAKFGGGGHKGAAGATLKMPLSDAVETMKNAMLETEFVWTES